MGAINMWNERLIEMLATVAHSRWVAATREAGSNQPRHSATSNGTYKIAQSIFYQQNYEWNQDKNVVTQTKLNIAAISWSRCVNNKVALKT